MKCGSITFSTRLQQTQSRKFVKKLCRTEVKSLVTQLFEDSDKKMNIYHQAYLKYLSKKTDADAEKLK
jgi:hypothetical protein